MKLDCIEEKTPSEENYVSHKMISKCCFISNCIGVNLNIRILGRQGFDELYAYFGKEHNYKLTFLICKMSLIDNVVMDKLKQTHFFWLKWVNYLNIIPFRGPVGEMRRCSNT
jgi:hypothetical protein